MASFLPALSPADVQRAAQLIQESYDPASSRRLLPDEHRRLQSELFELQRRWEAWGLVVPFLFEYDDPNVQFFGAHTAQVKISRDWESFPTSHGHELTHFLLNITARSISLGLSKVILRKLFVALSALALRLVPQDPSRWPNWIAATATELSSAGAFNEHVLDFLEIAVEEVNGADLLPAKRSQVLQSLSEAVPLVTQAVASSIGPSTDPTRLRQLQSALKCLEAWMPNLPSNDVTPLLPSLFALLDPAAPTFQPAVSAVLAVLSAPAFANGAGSATLTLPLLEWSAQAGPPIISTTLRDGPDDTASAFCRLLAGLGDHSIAYLTENLNSPLVQAFLHLTLSFTALPGSYGVDEEESERMLGFWYLLQEALWSIEFPPEAEATREKEMWALAKAVYAELVAALRTKVRWPPPPAGWAKDQVERFQVYRRDVGDTLINAYYVLRDDMLAYYLGDLTSRLQKKNEGGIWEDVEATLHCIMSIQEAVPLEPNRHLSLLFGSEILGQLPTSGGHRVQRTMLGLIGSYASWFTTLPAGSSEPLLSVLGYVAPALSELSLCLPAANALRDLCDANRTALAPHITAFGELHAGLSRVQDTEKAKVLQSISSVIQALPPEEEIAPVEAIVQPVVAKLFQALQSSSMLPEEALALATQQIQTLSGVAKGLTPATDAAGFESSPAAEEVERMQRVRDDIRMVRLREYMLHGIQGAIELWSTDAGISEALSDLFKSITALSADATLLSLPPAPLLELVCGAAQRQLTAVWLALANMLIIQLDPPAPCTVSLRTVPSQEVLAIVREVVRVLLQATLNTLSIDGAMEANPDIVQDFFNFAEKVSFHFVTVFYQLPRESFDALIQCAISALSLQERYSLVAASTFLTALIKDTQANDDLADAKKLLLDTHGRAMMRSLLVGFAGVSPKSAVPNLVELFSALVAKTPLESKEWILDVLHGSDFIQSRAGPEAKEALVKAVFSGSRSIRRTRDAVRQFTIVARGQEGSNFGFAW
ncbi:ARM repeat-containing protein [Russula earlei]|uniref:ARM repeat-containing protein n=1 Tax=Russula earlei TaxID=71964 RepID=A0ACC0UBH5_9AGAM|nr:ARM repeat-containing protein [Russula earlei]